MEVAAEQSSAKGTSVGGTDWRTNAVSSTGSARRDSTTARYDPAASARIDARTGEAIPLLHTLFAAAPAQVGKASDTAAVSPWVIRSTSRTSDAVGKSRVYAASTDAMGAQPR